MTFELIRALIGTWRLVATSAVEDAGQPLPPPYGPMPRGLVVFGTDGRIMAVLSDGRSALPAAAVENAREHLSYCGAFEFDGDTLITHVDGASRPDWLGTEQLRTVRFDGALLILTPPPRIIDGTTQRRTLTWERLGS
jgi:hypothetical protein